jgi:hypothetical protein
LQHFASLKTTDKIFFFNFIEGLPNKNEMEERKNFVPIYLQHVQTGADSEIFEGGCG